jgi:phosphomannomutase / phosphoglucomutase
MRSNLLDIAQTTGLLHFIRNDNKRFSIAFLTRFRLSLTSMDFELNPKIFREYDIRGIADSDLPEPMVEKIGRAIGTFLRAEGCKRVALGRDCRKSSPRIAKSIQENLMASGLDILDIGLVPTPLLYFAVNELDVQGGVMVTASHNPPLHNGFKICSGKSTIHGEEIQKIKHILLSGDFISGSGNIKEVDVKELYYEKVLASIRHPLNIKVVMDGGNGMAGVVAPELFRRLGCEVTGLFMEPDGNFPNHEPDPTVPENLESLIHEVKKQGVLAGVGFDGDADRIGVVDRTGRVIFGDELLVLYARQLLKEHPGATVISEVKSSNRLYDDVRKHGGRAIQWKTGHSLIKSKMKTENALLAGEMSGHMFFADRYYGYDDAVYAAARFFEILSDTGKTPNELLADLPPAFSTPEIRVECSDESKFQVVEDSKAEFRKMGLNVNDIDGARIEFSDGWGLVRASNTQPVLVFRFEAQSQKRLQEIRTIIEDVVLKRCPSPTPVAP